MIFYNIAKRDFIRIHGPEHHILDGAALLTAYFNAGGNINLQNSLVELMQRGLQDPTGQNDELFRDVIKQIEEKIMSL